MKKYKSYLKLGLMSVLILTSIITSVYPQAVGNLAYSNDSHKIVSATVNIKRGPAINALTNTSVVIAWRTDANTSSVVQYGTTSALGSEVRNNTLTTLHIVKLDGLSPGTTYYYRVGGDTYWSANYTFTTDSGADEFTFAVLGDSRGDVTNKPPEVFSTLINLIKNDNPALTVMTGDHILSLTSSESSTTTWEYVTNVTDTLQHTVPIYVAIGNHDDPEGKSFLETWNYGCGNQRYFSINYGNSHFIILDSEQDGYEGALPPAELNWLKNDLEQNTAAHTFVFVHRPMYPQSAHVGDSLNKNVTLRDLLHDLFVQHYVDAVFVAHEHNYVRETFDGLLQIISGGAGAPLVTVYVTSPEYPDFVYYKTHHYMKIHVNGTYVDINAIDSSGNVIDTIHLNSTHNPKPVINNITWTPEMPQANTPITFRVNATDDGEITSVKVYYKESEQSSWTELSTSYSNGVYETSQVSISTGEGEYLVFAQAFDNSGNAINSSIKSFVIDSTPPEVSIISPKNGDTITGTELTIAISASDNIGIDHVEIYVDGNLKFTDSISPYSKIIDISNLSTGDHNITVIAYDKAGNTATATIVIHISKEVPTPPISMIGIGVGAIALVVIIVIFMKKRK